MPAADLPLLIDAALAAGRVAAGFTGPTAKRWEKPGDAGPVTEADLAVNASLHDQLRQARPDYGWLSEESEDDADRLAAPRVFIIDPIDGTRSFANGSRTWAHSIAVAEQGVVTAGVIYLPQRDLLFAAAAGQGATLNGAPIRSSGTRHLTSAKVLATKVNMQPEFWRGTIPQLDRSHRPSLAYRMALVAQGRFDAMLTFRPTWEWDIAAGDLILREAGAQVTDRNGKPLRFNNATPALNGVVAGNTVLHEQLVGAVQPN